MRGTLTILRKDLAGLVRDHRLTVFLALLALVLTLPYTLLTSYIVGTGSNPPGLAEPLEALHLLTPIVLLLLAVLVTSPSISREREEGTLTILGATPVHDTGLYLGKLLTSLSAYALTALTLLLFLAPWTPTLGTAFLEVAAWSFLIPYLALYLFLSSLTLLLSSVLDTTTGSITTSFGVGLVLFLAQREAPGLGQLLASIDPSILTVLKYTPFDAAYTATARLEAGQALPTGPLLVTLLAALALVAAGLAVTTHREVQR